MTLIELMENKDLVLNWDNEETDIVSVDYTDKFVEWFEKEQKIDFNDENLKIWFNNLLREALDYYDLKKEYKFELNYMKLLQSNNSFKKRVQEYDSKIREEEEEEPEIERSRELSLETPKEEEKDESPIDEPVIEEEEAKEKEKKVPFWKKLFGGSKKEDEDEFIIEQVPGPDDIIVEKEPEQLPARKEIGRDETVLQFMFDFDISEERAQAIYDMGYRNKAEFKDAIPKDLIMIKGINPTIAKKIVEKANE